MISSKYYTDDTPVKLFGKGICEAHDCTSVATTAINVNLGELGFITLYLCENVHQNSKRFEMTTLMINHTNC